MTNSFLPYLDLFIVYSFCIFQIAYNVLTIIKIKQCKNKVSFSKLIFSYFFWTYPIIYSILPIILSFRTDFDFGIFMIYLRIPPVIITAILILGWTFYIQIHNKHTNTLKNIQETDFSYDESNFKSIMNSKNFFKKNIIKINVRYVDRVNKANNNQELIKIIADIQGWFIGKDKFSWMWLKKKQVTQNFYKQIFENVCYMVKEKSM